VNPSWASVCIRFGRVKASERKTVSGCSRCTSPITHSQKAKGLVCGLSTRNVRTPWPIQNRKMSRQASHKAWR
jgi:hypothetical protein